MSKPKPEELLSAYASGGLGEADRARVEAYLENHPEAVSELSALGAVIGEVRHAADAGPRPQLAALRASISSALDEVDREREHRRSGMWTFFRQRSPIFIGAALAAAVLVVLVVSRRDRRAVPGTGGGEAPALASADSPPEPGPSPEADGMGALEEPLSTGGDEIAAIEMLAVEELDAIDEEIFAAIEEIEDSEGEAWDELLLSDSDLSWIDDLSEEELALLDETLSELEAS